MNQNKSRNKKYYEAKEASTLLLINSQLKKQPRGLNFNDITTLAKHLAPKTGMHWTTLLRNSRYRETLNSFIYTHSEQNINAQRFQIDPIEITKRDLTISNLHSDISRLHNYIKANISVDATLRDIQEAPASIRPDRTLKNFDLTCAALQKLLAYTLSIGIKINDKGEITDINSTISSEEIVVVDSALTKAFVQWIKERSGTP